MVSSRRENEMRIYLRAEPDEEGRELLLSHRSYFASVLKKIGVQPLLSPRHDFHRTEIFLGSAHDWMKIFQMIGCVIELTKEDIVSLLEMPEEEKKINTGEPEKYDIFFARQGHFAGVIRLNNSEFMVSLVSNAEKRLEKWVEFGKVSRENLGKFIAHPQYPLARTKSEPKPHVTLLRGNIRNENIRKLTLEVTEKLPLESQTAIKFTHIDIRAVRSTQVLGRFAG